MTQLVEGFLSGFQLLSKKMGARKPSKENKTVGFLWKYILFAFDARDTIGWLATYRVAVLSCGALRDFIVWLAPLEGKMNKTPAP